MEINETGFFGRTVPLIRITEGYVGVEPGRSMQGTRESHRGKDGFGDGSFYLQVGESGILILSEAPVSCQPTGIISQVNCPVWAFKPT